MGIIINDSITLNNGINLTGCYCSLYESMINITKNNDNNNSKKYRVDTIYTIWANKDARTNELTCVNRDNISLNLDASQLETDVNIFTLLYNEIKSKYTSYTDDI